MRLIDKLNNIHFVGDAAELTFTIDNEGNDIDPDFARAEVVDLLIDMGRKITRVHQEEDNPSPPICERLKQLCIYGAALFEAIDAYEAYSDDMDCRDVPR